MPSACVAIRSKTASSWCLLRRHRRMRHRQRRLRPQLHEHRRKLLLRLHRWIPPSPERERLHRWVLQQLFHPRLLLDFSVCHWGSVFRVFSIPHFLLHSMIYIFYDFAVSTLHSMVWIFYDMYVNVLHSMIYILVIAVCYRFMVS